MENATTSEHRPLHQLMTGRKHTTGSMTSPDMEVEQYGHMLLRNPSQIFQLLLEGQGLDRMSRYFTQYTLLFAGLYGLLLGCYAGGWQLAVGAIKVPMLLFGTLVLCLPALYIFNMLLGGQLSFRQTISMVLGGTYLMSTIL